MKLDDIIECAMNPTEDEETMTAAEIESTLDDIMNELGDDNPGIAKQVEKINIFLQKKDLVSATKAMTKLMNKVRSMNS